jgi:hypothetical protein
MKNINVVDAGSVDTSEAVYCTHRRNLGSATGANAPPILFLLKNGFFLWLLS